MVSIDTMYTMDSRFTAHNPPHRKKLFATMWADVNALRKEISMSEKERSKQRAESLLNELEQETASLTDEDFARLERMIMERRDRAAEHVIAVPSGTAQSSNPRSRCSE